jgi:hypothetical protein
MSKLGITDTAEGEKGKGVRENMSKLKDSYTNHLQY